VSVSELNVSAGAVPQRLQKIIAAAGLASRRKAETLITEGRVRVNGQVVTELGAKADPARDHIRVDGKLLQGPEQPRYYMLNKPKGYVTTVSDPEKRPTVMKFFERVGTRVFPVGRLDYQSEGLLLMTNDGALANALTRAAARVEKTYLVKVSGRPTESAIEQLRRGIMIERGKPGGGSGRVLTEPATIRLMRDAENPWYEVVLTEGRNRQIRKLFEEIGHHVEKIRRVGYGTLVLDLPPGEVRELEPREVAALERAGRPRKKAAEPPRALRKVEERHLPATRPARKRVATKRRSAKHVSR
jgi:23S rRNA pseudouridine2605 synthase